MTSPLLQADHMPTNKPTERAEAFAFVRQYLAHPDVQAIPFALPASNALRVFDELAARDNDVRAELLEALRELYEHGQDVELDSSETLQGHTAESNRAMDKARAILTKCTDR